MIKEILYATSEHYKKLTRPAFELAEFLGEKFSIPVSKYYDGDKINPNCILIGTNHFHQLSGGISDLPLVVIDNHTDMFANGTLKLSYGYGTWVYYQIKNRPEVHLIIPSTDGPSLGRSCIPEGYEQNLHTYSLDSLNKIKFYILKDDELIVKELEKDTETLENLSKISSPKQVSIDFDFLQSTAQSNLEKIMDGLNKDGDIYDFWLDTYIYHLDVNENKPFDRYVPIFEKIHAAE